MVSFLISIKPTLRRDIPSASERSPSRTIHRTFKRAGFFFLSKVFMSCMKRFLVTNLLIGKIMQMKMPTSIPFNLLYIYSSIASKVQNCSWFYFLNVEKSYDHKTFSGLVHIIGTCEKFIRKIYLHNI